MNTYDYEDAFTDANRCAGRRTKLADALKLATTDLMARTIINDCQDRYLNLFEAFIEGVAWERERIKKEARKNGNTGTNEISDR